MMTRCFEQIDLIDEYPRAPVRCHRLKGHNGHHWAWRQANGIQYQVIWNQKPANTPKGEPGRL